MKVFHKNFHGMLDLAFIFSKVYLILLENDALVRSILVALIKKLQNTSWHQHDQSLFFSHIKFETDVLDQ